MNATNRGVNRAVLLLVGAVLVLAGGALAATTAWPGVGELWETRVSAAVRWMRDADAGSRISETTASSWFTVGLLAVLLLVVVIAVLVIARLGGGRSGAVIREEAATGPQGAVTIRHGFASDAIAHSLASREEILSSRVSARRVRGADVLHVSITPRQNASPRAVAETASELVDNLAALTGRDTPTLVSIRSGIRSRLAADQPRVN